MTTRIGLIAAVVAATFAVTGAAHAYYIEGSVFCDANGDMSIDAGDDPLPGVEVVVTPQGDVGVERSDVTSIDGRYLIEFLTETTYLTSLEAATLPGDSIILNGETYLFTISPSNIRDKHEFLIDSKICHAPICGDGILDEGEICDDGNNVDGDGCSAICTDEVIQGCTPGYWKQDHHFDSWSAPYTPDTLFSDVFEDAFPGKTLLDVAWGRGGGLNALGRHTVAALLNAASSDVASGASVDQIIDAFDAVYPGSKSEYNALKGDLVEMNESGCPLN